MTEETKKLFDAPWTIYGEPDDYSFVLQDASEDEIATIFTTDNAKRIARLPELYDALAEAAAGKCWSCAGESSETMLDHPCPKGHDEDCYVAKWRELLKFVRDGK